ncbi:MAG: hypothetical protein ABIY52_09360 [Gemmatimonadaceae bacterium]
MTAAAPAIVRDLAPATLEYHGTFTAAERTMAITSTLTVAQHPAGGWAVAEHAVLPRGSAVDSARLEANTLVPRERTIRQGPLSIALAFADGKATGTATSANETHSIEVALCGSLVADGAGAFLVIGRLPLADGYRIALRHLDVQKAEQTSKYLVVLGSERTLVSAGSYDTWKVQVSEKGNTNATIIWVDKASLVPVKFSSVQGPVTVTMELDARR